MRDYHPSARLIEARDALVGDTWSLEQTPTARRAVAVQSAHGVSWLEVRHDLAAAPEPDLEFVAAVRADVDALLGSLNSRASLSPDHLAKIVGRHNSATPGPWQCYSESGGGLGGSNVITLGGSDADLYLYLDGRLAPDPEWVFVALAHSEVPPMVDAVRKLARD